MTASASSPSTLDTAAYRKYHIRTVPDWPAPGVQFRDIAPLLDFAGH